ncbi:MAG: MATE family efflux transporter [Ruminococcus sp.]|nr:MATE family efflux transporter [Ruminococcus sp.]
MNKKYEMDMCNGPLLSKILIFALPLMASGVLQLLFNAADIIVVGQFSGSQALAAVGSTSALVNLFTNVFIGFSIGTNVLVAQFFAAKDDKNVFEIVHTSILLAFIGGIFLILVVIPFAPVILAWMGTPDDVLSQAALYIRILFVGMPMMLVYNFGAAILRAIGDTRRPLYYLAFSGVINVVLNLIFVIVFHMGVAGVALATIISQTISALLVCKCLMQSDGMYRLDIKSLHINKGKMMAIVRIGLPAGLQGAVFSISNVLIQSSVNSFGSVAMAGNTAGNNIEGFVYTAMNALYQTALSFTSQNLGGGKHERIRKVAVQCLILVTLIGAVFGNLAIYFGDTLLGFYSSDPEVIAFGLRRLTIMCRVYFLCGLMDVTVGVLRGLGAAMSPMIISLTGACGLRVLWIFTVFQWHRSLETLYISYPITWTITWLAQLICLFIIWKKNVVPRIKEREAA